MTTQLIILSMMKHTVCVVVLLVLTRVHCVRIAFLDNAILSPVRSTSIGTISANGTCDQCICLALQNASLVALNCYPNSTCLFYLKYPRAYNLQPLNNSRLYFLQNILPNASNPCCISNTTYLLDKLQQSINTSISMNVSKPRCLLLDESGSIVTVEQVDILSSSFARIDPTTLTFRQRTLHGAIPTNIAYHNNQYYIGFDVNKSVSVFSNDETNNTLTFLSSITAAPLNMNGVRDMIFLNNSQTMVIASADNGYLFFYSLINNTNYTMTSYIQVTYSTPHGLYRINDSFFYVASWSNPSLYAYNYDNTSINWTQTLFVNANINSSIAGSHVTIDDCNRRWFTMYNYGIRIYDDNGINVGNWSLDGGYFDTLLLDNYIVILSDIVNSKIIRVDPQVQCDDN